jgi:hypothetical protein
MCLKPPVLLWLAVLYLSRAVVLPLASAIGHFVGLDNAVITMLRGYWSAQTLLPSLAALPVFYCLFRRVPKASGPVRWIWRHGRALLIVSAGIDLVLSALQLLHSPTLGDEPIFPLSTAAVDVYFLVYLLAARRARDTFLDFPLP